VFVFVEFPLISIFMCACLVFSLFLVVCLTADCNLISVPSQQPAATSTALSRLQDTRGRGINKNSFWEYLLVDCFALMLYVAHKILILFMFVFSLPR
jgi:hypothetical protein